MFCCWLGVATFCYPSVLQLELKGFSTFFLPPPLPLSSDMTSIGHNLLPFAAGIDHLQGPSTPSLTFNLKLFFGSFLLRPFLRPSRTQTSLPPLTGPWRTACHHYYEVILESIGADVQRSIYCCRREEMTEGALNMQTAILFMYFLLLCM